MQQVSYSRRLGILREVHPAPNAPDMEVFFVIIQESRRELGPGSIIQKQLLWATPSSRDGVDEMFFMIRLLFSGCAGDSDGPKRHAEKREDMSMELLW